MQTKLTSFTKSNFFHLRAAVNTQLELANDKAWTIASPGFLNVNFSERQNRFNFHLHHNESIVSNTADRKNLSESEQSSLLLAYVQRKEMAILIIRGTLAAPVTRADLFLDALLSVLWERYSFFHASPESGLTILLTGDLQGFTGPLEALLLEAAQLHEMPPEFLDWIEASNLFCSLYSLLNINNTFYEN